MEWLIVPNIIEPNDACLLYECWDRNKSCIDKNTCSGHLCSLR